MPNATVVQVANSLRRKKWHGRRGFVTDMGWPFRLDIPREYQDWIIVAVCVLLIGLWCLPCFCGRMRNRCSRPFTNWVYTRMHVFYWGVVYFTLFILMFMVTVLPDWSMREFLDYSGRFLHWVLVHVQKMIVSACIIIAFMMALKFRERIALVAGMEHMTLFRWGVLDFFGFKGKQRPIELFLWKVEGLQSSNTKILKANDIYIEVHLGYNEPMRTRVHNNAGTGCILRETLQLNINEDSPADLLTLLVKDQTVMASSELARLNLATREMCGIEDQTGKRRRFLDFTEEFFVPLSLSPQGTIWVAIAPVEDWDDSERTPLIHDDELMTC